MIKAGMTVAEAIAQLTRGFIKMTGRNPDGLEKIKIKQEAVEKLKDLEKVVDMEGKFLDPSKPIMGGTQTGMFDNIFNKMQKQMGKGDPKEVKKDPEKKSMGGRIGLKDGITPSFEEYMRERQSIEQQRNLEQMYKEYLEDLRRKKVAEEKFMAADGGRIGLKDGPDQPGRRNFMKIMGGLATIPFIGKFFRQADKVAPAAEKVAEVAGQAPSYFFDLVAKIKSLGRMSDGPAERIKVYSMKGKDGNSELMLTEDIGTGEMQIKKIGKEGDDMVTEVQTMEYTPGSSMADETTKGIPADNYEEYTEINSRIYKDDFNDPDIVAGINVEDIMKEVKDQAPPIKKAGGGLAYMLGE